MKLVICKHSYHKNIKIQANFVINLMSEEKKESEVEAKSAEDSASEQPSAEDTAKAESEKALEDAKQAD